MRHLIRLTILLMAGWPAWASNVDVVGLSSLRELFPTLNGAGVSVAQPEAGSPAWQVNPAVVGQPQNRFTWTSSVGTTNAFPNSLGQESSHADFVGGIFYGITDGAAPGVARVDNYEAGFFATALVPAQTTIAARIVNQSFAFTGQITTTDRNFDNYAARYNTLFLSGVGNSGAPSSPSTCFNGLGVGSSDGAASTGPTSDGRCKPDISAPGNLTSFTTPLVSGCAAVLLQAGARGDAGPGTTNAASHPLTLKALLLNGATKPSAWTNSPDHPLDFKFGAGVANVFHSHRQLRGGRHPFVATSTPLLGGAHPPPANATNVAARRGWAFLTNTTTTVRDTVHHFLFDLRGDSNRLFTLSATLVWNRQLNKTAINNLDLFLFDADTSNQVAASQSSVDNVEHLFLTNLPPRRYDLQVWKSGGPAVVSQAETYALAFDFGPPLTAQLREPGTTGGAFRARLVGEPYTTHLILGSSNLIHWTAVTTNSTGGAGSFNFTNALAPGPAGMFYRGQWVP